MARPITYWLDIMFEEKASHPILSTWEPNINSTQDLLNAITSTSRVSIFALILWCVAACAVAMDSVFQLAVVALTLLVEKSKYGGLPWYVDIAKEFQYGDNLVQVKKEWVYDPIDPTHRIIALAAAKEGTGVVNVKVAKIVAVDPEPLSAPELAAFEAYLEQRKPAGININVVNDLPDELRVWLSVIIDPLVLKADGESILKPGTYPVEDAIKTYLKSLDFDGKFDLMRLIDAVQTVAGVISAYVNSASARFAANPFVVFNQTYYSNAGYMVIDPTTPLNTTITYSNV